MLASIIGSSCACSREIDEHGPAVPLRLRETGGVVVHDAREFATGGV
jgi:hypothetical protein